MGEIEEEKNEIISLGANIAGGISGGLVGALIAGPVGAVLGGVAGPVLTEFSQRALSRREKMRVGSIFYYVASKANENLSSGAKVRTDDFFTKKLNERSSANEIFEGVLRSAQKEHQERKLPYYGNLLANIAFSPEIDRDEANLLIKLADELSYRQLCLLALFAGTQLKSTLRKGDYRAQAATISRNLVPILQEVYELDSMGLINASGEVLLGLTDVKPGAMQVQGTGMTLGKLMELQRIPADDLTPIAEQLR